MKNYLMKDYPNYHAARMKDPSLFVRIRVIKTTNEGVMFYGGPLKSKPKGPVEIASVRFPKDKFTVAQAKKWMKDHDLKYILFEPARKISKTNLRIEDVTKENLANLNDSDVWKLRFRCTQLWDKHFAKSSDIVVGALNREILLEKYTLITEVLKKRGKQILTSEIDRAVFRNKLQKKNEKSHDIVVVPITKNEDEHIFAGIVYEPNVVDSQGDSASEEVIRKLCYSFMENSQMLKMSHRGDALNVKILENYLAPVDFTIEGRAITKGSWILVTRVLDENVWAKIKKGELQGYSMAGVGIREIV